MARMRTFFLYFIGLVGFIFLSYILENGLIENMYVKMGGSVDSGSSSIVIDDVEGKASYMNGFMQFTLKNNSNEIKDRFLKIDLYSEQGLEAATKYVAITDLDSGSTKRYNVKFKGNDISTYKIQIVDSVPDRSNIINLLGWDIDLTDVFGMDLSNMRLFGIKLTDLFAIDNIKTAGNNAWSWSISFLNSIPWWGYAIGAGIVLWYMPSKFLFGIFP